MSEQRSEDPQVHAAGIRALNDEFRTGLKGGDVLVTQGVSAHCDVAAVLAQVRAFDDFTAANDPYGEHDFGAFEAGKETIFWKIDYYDKSITQGSQNAADPEITRRVLTILLAEEY